MHVLAGTPIKAEHKKGIKDMAVSNPAYTAIRSTNEQASLMSDFTDMREVFRNWLVIGNARKYSPDAIIFSIDMVSDYAISKKISAMSIWKYTKYGAFSPVYTKLVEAKLLRFIDRNLHKTFITAGQLYLRFLKDEMSVCRETIATNTDEKAAESAFEPMQADADTIDPKDVITWLVTQPNANGSLYLKSVARQYMSTLRSVSSKIEISAAKDGVFSCRTPDALNAYWEKLKAAPNYQQVNRDSSGMLSAGLGCYMRYLQHLCAIHEAQQQDILHVNKYRNSEQLPHSEIVSPEDAKPVNSTLIERLQKLLSTHFSNGFRLNSPIEMVRLRFFAASDIGENLALTDEELKHHISSCGMIYSGKVYMVSTETKERIKELIKACFVSGAKVVFYEELYSKNENWLFNASIVSEDMLVSIIRTIYPGLLFTQTYFGFTNASIYSVLESEILRVWGDDVLLTYDKIAERLPYIPLDRIKYALGQNGDFIWNGIETFSHISRIEITDSEQESIRAAAIRECNTHGYVSITVLPYKDIEERNYELSITALHNAIYRICLIDMFDKKGKIVTRKGDVFDAYTIMEEYCRTIDQCSLDDLLDYEKELTGEVHRWIPMEAGNSVLVRISKDTYVADRYVSFDVDLIDATINRVMTDDYIPLKAFTTFSTFPDCGQIWNLFVLESYCRRFSREFRFESPSVNSRNAGVIIRKSCDMDYIEIMTDAVVNNNVLLKPEAVGHFLFENGYTGRSSNSKVAEIIDRAKTLRERRG